MDVRGVGGIHHDLGDPVAVAHVEEDKLAEVAAAVAVWVGRAALDAKSVKKRRAEPEEIVV